MTLPETICIVETGPCDRLQNEPSVVRTKVEVGFDGRVAATELPVVEAGPSFPTLHPPVHPRHA